MKYNSIGEQLIAKAKEIDPSYKSDKFNDMSEALDIILNNSSAISIFDVTPYYTVGETSIGIEGYKALKEFVSKNQGGIVKVPMFDGVYYYFSCSGEVNETDDLPELMIFTSCTIDDGSISGMTFQVFSDGHFTVSDTTISNNSNAITSLNNDVASLDTRISTLEGWNIDDISGRVSTLEGKIWEVDDLNMRVGDLENSIGDLENSIGNINTLLDEINGEAI